MHCYSQATHQHRTDTSAVITARTSYRISFENATSKVYDRTHVEKPSVSLHAAASVPSLCTTIRSPGDQSWVRATVLDGEKRSVPDRHDCVTRLMFRREYGGTSATLTVSRTAPMKLPGGMTYSALTLAVMSVVWFGVTEYVTLGTACRVCTGQYAAGGNATRDTPPHIALDHPIHHDRTL